ncbi:hypothetical protein BDD12DRAFT_150366 [Trichophaea hybrida]|nr:hypothetical protein BDD12DRAFT_150366 [Trichophaea hybrida]
MESVARVGITNAQFLLLFLFFSLVAAHSQSRSHRFLSRNGARKAVLTSLRPLGAPKDLVSETLMWRCVLLLLLRCCRVVLWETLVWGRNCVGAEGDVVGCDEINGCLVLSPSSPIRLRVPCAPFHAARLKILLCNKMLKRQMERENRKALGETNQNKTIHHLEVRRRLIS